MNVKKPNEIDDHTGKQNKYSYHMQAKVFTPPIFMAQEPQIPSRQDLLNVRVGSISFFILIRASKTIGPHLQYYKNI